MTCTTHDGLNYIATSKDKYIINTMYTNRRNYNDEDMHWFHDVARKFYDVDDSSGLFLDLGANIGTTGIYFTKKVAPNLKLLAFEPDAENFKLHRINLILNDLEYKATLENYGLGIEDSEQIMYRDSDNPGHNGMFSQESGGVAETIRITSLDKYFSKNNLSADDIKYIWIDTEGFEPQVLLGAKSLLRKNPAPVFMEFNPQWWQKSGYFEQMIEFLSEIYSSYVRVQEIRDIESIQVNPIEKLREFQNSTLDFGQGGDIFLIRK